MGNPGPINHVDSHCANTTCPYFYTSTIVNLSDLPWRSLPFSGLFLTHGGLFLTHGGLFLTHGGLFLTHGGLFLTHGGLFLTHGGLFLTHGGLLRHSEKTPMSCLIHTHTGPLH